MTKEPARVRTQADAIIAKFGTQTALAAALGLRHTVVAGWKKRGWVPAERHKAVINAGVKLGLVITPADFFDYDWNPEDALAPEDGSTE